VTLTSDRDQRKVRRVLTLERSPSETAPEEELGPASEKPTPIENRCLSCDRLFKAPTKFHRLCDPCRKNAGRLYLPQYEGW